MERDMRLSSHVWHVLMTVMLYYSGTAFGVGTIGDAAPSFSLKDLGGAGFSYPSDAKGAPVVINFFATWCTTCEEEIPLLRGLKEKYPEAVYVAVNAGDSDNKVRKFVKKYGFPWRVLLDADKSVAKTYGVPGLPVTMVIDKAGKIRFRSSRPPADLDSLK